MRYLAVDLGNVICNVDFNPFILHLSRTLNVSIDDVNYFLNRTNKLHDLGITSVSDELKDHFKIRSSVLIDELLVSWNSVIGGNKKMVAFLTRLLQAKDTEVALLSNIGTDHAALLRDLLTPFVFDSSIKFLSCEVGARKPSLLYYKTFLDIYPNFKGCLYLDDRMENVEVGRKMGLNAVHFVLDKTDAADIDNKILEFASKI